MDEALTAVTSLHTRFDEGDGHVSLRSAGVIALALERKFVHSELRAIAEYYGSADAKVEFLVAFIGAWTKVMNADRFDVSLTPEKIGEGEIAAELLSELTYRAQRRASAWTRSRRLPTTCRRH